MNAPTSVKLTRRWLTALSTCGLLGLDGVFQAYTLEPRSDRSHGKPYCIPAGNYEILLQWSPKFGCLTPHLQNVPGFTEIEIHWGDYPSDTEGCILVGNSHAPDFIGGGTRIAFASLMNKLAAAKDGITITIVDFSAAENSIAAAVPAFTVTDPELGM